MAKSKGKEVVESTLKQTPANLEPQKHEVSLYSSYQQLKAIATDLHQSGLFTHLKNPQQAIAIVEYGRELGVPPMQALQTMAVINGKVGMESKLLLGLAKRIGYDMDIVKSTDKECVISFITPSGKKHKVDFTLEEAKQMGSATKYDGTLKDAYKKQPANMLVQRAIAKAVRRFAPESLLADGSGIGMYTIEELSNGEATTVEELAEFEVIQEKQKPKTTPKPTTKKVTTPAKKTDSGLTKPQTELIAKLRKSHVWAKSDLMQQDKDIAKGINVIDKMQETIDKRKKMEKWICDEAGIKVELNGYLLKFLTETSNPDIVREIPDEIKNWGQDETQKDLNAYLHDLLMYNKEYKKYVKEGK